MKSPVLTRLLAANKQWAAQVTAANPHFFRDSAEHKQKPEILWIGCADSRVPESVLLAQMPGVVFVHRNIANQVLSNDDSVSSTIQYAVKNLGVKHIVVAGHSVCGGCAAALEITQCGTAPAAPLGRYLADLAAFVKENRYMELRTVIEENVKLQVRRINANKDVRDTWGGPSPGDGVYVHGWVYELENGHARDLHYTLGPPVLT